MKNLVHWDAGTCRTWPRFALHRAKAELYGIADTNWSLALRHHKSPWTHRSNGWHWWARSVGEQLQRERRRGSYHPENPSSGGRKSSRVWAAQITGELTEPSYSESRQWHGGSPIERVPGPAVELQSALSR